jgi:hypothetical protein
MSRTLLLILCFMVISAPSYLLAKDDVYLLRIDIEGNQVTRTAFIRDLLTMRERTSYSFDEIIDEINRSRENLERTGLFSYVFFNDALDEQNNLTLTVQLRENNYLFFGLSGYLGYEDDEFHSVSSLYLDYTNLLGNASRLYLEVPFYRDYGIIARFNGRDGGLRYAVGIDARYDYFWDLYVQKFVLNLGYAFSEKFLLSTDIHVHRESPRGSELTNLSNIFLPFLQWGYVRRPNSKQRKWHSLRLRPYFGINLESIAESERSTFQGIFGRVSFNWDLFLKIVYSLDLYGEYQSGDVPFDYIIQSNIRGTYFDAYRGSYLVSARNNLDFPLPTNTNIRFVPLLDFGVIGDEAQGAEFLIGGGLGLHWYTRFQNPFVFEVAYGKGLMVNLTKRF